MGRLGCAEGRFRSLYTEVASRRPLCSKRAKGEIRTVPESTSIFQVPVARPELRVLADHLRVTFGLTSYPKYEYLGYMSAQEEKDRLELLQGTLDLLILRTLIFGPQHGQGIARVIQQTSQDELLVEHGALYPALQRLEERGGIAAEWGTSANNRKARFYTLTPAGRKQLVKETTKWRRLAAAIGRVLGPEAGEG
jgi:PadR family transcriptional regulator, regulatory protein PadR